MKRMIWLSIGILAALALIAFFMQLSEAQKRYLLYFARQIPFLPARYMV